MCGVWPARVQPCPVAASNKKEARKLAAKAACSALFGVVFDEHPTSNAPVLAKTE